MPRLSMLALATLLCGSASAAPRQPHNVILFVADGLRSQIVTPATAPTLAAIRAQGVDFRNSHSLYPTITTVNGAAIATGHGVGDTGDFGNLIYTGEPLPGRKGAPAAPLENDGVLAALDARYGGSYLSSPTLLQVARRAGYSVAVVGKLGPAAIQSGGDPGVIVIDDDTGRGQAFQPPADVLAAIHAAGLADAAPARGANDQPGDVGRPGTHVANVVQQDWFAAVATRVLLPRFKAARRPFVLVFWSRDPDASQHEQGDSFHALSPGINGPTSKAGIRNADDDLARLRAALTAQGLDRTTDVVVTADHGFSTIARNSRTSPAAQGRYADTPPGELPPGFLAMDLGKALGLPVRGAPDGSPLNIAAGQHPAHGYALLGPDPAHPQIVIASNGGSNLIYLPGPAGRTLAPAIVRAVWAQDYASAVFVDDVLGPLPGAFPLSAIGLEGAARTPRPAIVVAFRSRDGGCGQLCQIDVSDTGLQTGQGMHGSLGRGDTHNFMAAVGPDFRHGFVDPAPVSNADLAPTLARILDLPFGEGGALRGRVLTESLAGGAPVAARKETQHASLVNGQRPVLSVQTVGAERYIDFGGLPGRFLAGGD